MPRSEERYRSQRTLADRLRFEELVARLSGSFVHLPSDRMGEVFDASLARIGMLLAMDRMWLLRFSGDGADLGIHKWDAPGLDPLSPVDVKADYPWAMTLLSGEKPLRVERLERVPPEAARDCDSLRRRGIRRRPDTRGGLAFVMVTAERAWPDEEVARLQLVAEVFASALARKESEDALRESEEMKSAILGSLGERHRGPESPRRHHCCQPGVGAARSLLGDACAVGSCGGQAAQGGQRPRRAFMFPTNRPRFDWGARHFCSIGGARTGR